MILKIFLFERHHIMPSQSLIDIFFESNFMPVSQYELRL